jgi:hypothetical protein
MSAGKGSLGSVDISPVLDAHNFDDHTVLSYEVNDPVLAASCPPGRSQRWIERRTNLMWIVEQWPGDEFPSGDRDLLR